jgi:predicted dehydrogenase
MALNYKECEEMIRVSEQTGSPLFVAYYRRMLPGFLKVKEMIDSGAIGTPDFFTIRFFMPPLPEDLQHDLPWRVKPEISGGGYLFDLASHQLDFIDYLLGPVEQVSSLAFNRKAYYEPEDFVSAGFRCINKVAGAGVWNFSSSFREDRIEICGDKGKIIFSCFNFDEIQLVSEGKISVFENKRPEHVQQPLIQTIVSELLGSGKCPSTGYTAARTSKLLDAMVNSIPCIIQG